MCRKRQKSPTAETVGDSGLDIRFYPNICYAAVNCADPSTSFHSARDDRVFDGAEGELVGRRGQDSSPTGAGEERRMAIGHPYGYGGS